MGENPSQPIIQVRTLYNGPASELQAIVKLLLACNPIFTDIHPTPWTNASHELGWGFGDIPCTKGNAIYRFPVGAQSFDGAAMRKTYDCFDAGLAKQPAFGYSLVLWEAYSTHAVKAVADDATAVADRADAMLVAAFVICPPGQEEELGPELEALGLALRKCMLSEGAEMHAYVNYAHGDESLAEMYGHQAWRLERLRKLKKEYDPQNRFGFYSPIV